ncbi:uncharacterized protein MELLADRAFT_89935 [Melampsora larici-populina 98AG31]|uniref:Uncharacterized protein n=1 Tax=Melampsora larici-populina (strain 98AG31 / pathotype 3-4-7) TaxID=747676 RepID=F4RV58_MELLP|nr:uncharacterized protein MELLADRAFT_89935 [Melampsora larici-populina 98AG31]EGG03723.1 hypothetical protein MELLADRAFT_89935 [Melampsora larici-populina 98AG31]
MEDLTHTNVLTQIGEDIIPGDRPPTPSTMDMDTDSEDQDLDDSNTQIKPDAAKVLSVPSHQAFPQAPTVPGPLSQLQSSGLSKAELRRVTKAEFERNCSHPVPVLRQLQTGPDIPDDAIEHIEAAAAICEARVINLRKGIHPPPSDKVIVIDLTRDDTPDPTVIRRSDRQTSGVKNYAGSQVPTKKRPRLALDPVRDDGEEENPEEEEDDLDQPNDRDNLDSTILPNEQQNKPVPDEHPVQTQTQKTPLRNEAGSSSNEQPSQPVPEKNPFQTQNQESPPESPPRNELGPSSNEQSSQPAPEKNSVQTETEKSTSTESPSRTQVGTSSGPTHSNSCSPKTIEPVTHQIDPITNPTSNSTIDPRIDPNITVQTVSTGASSSTQAASSLGPASTNPNAALENSAPPKESAELPSTGQITNPVDKS